MRPPYLPGETFDAYMMRTSDRYRQRHTNAPTCEEGLKHQEQLGDHGVEIDQPSNQVTKLLCLEEKNARPHETSVASEAAMMIDRYGDVMGVIDNHPAFEIVTRPIAQGGWEIFPQALTNAVRANSPSGDLAEGLQKVMDTIKYVKLQRNSKSKAGLFWYVLKNGTLRK